MQVQAPSTISSSIAKTQTGGGSGAGVLQGIRSATTFAKAVKGEVHKTTWPEANGVLPIFFMVAVVCLVAALFFALSDYMAYKMINTLITH